MKIYYALSSPRRRGSRKQTNWVPAFAGTTN